MGKDIIMSVIQKQVKIKDTVITGVEIPFSKAPLVLAKTDRGFVMCGYLNIEAAEKLGQAAAMVTGVKTVEDLLAAKIVKITSAAEENGVAVGMSGREALEKMI